MSKHRFKKHYRQIKQIIISVVTVVEYEVIYRDIVYNFLRTHDSNVILIYFIHTAIHLFINCHFVGRVERTLANKMQIRILVNANAREHVLDRVYLLYKKVIARYVFRMKGRHFMTHADNLCRGGIPPLLRGATMAVLNFKWFYTLMQFIRITLMK